MKDKEKRKRDLQIDLREKASVNTLILTGLGM
jgi:hypothetical protein